MAFEANKSVLSKCARHSHASMVALCIKGSELYFVSAGDCMALIVRGEHVLELNRKHTNLSYEYEQIALKGMRDLPEKMVTSFIGAKDMELDSNFLPIRIEKGDRILLINSGVSDALYDSDLAECLQDRDIRTGAKRIEKLISSANLQQAQNYTAIIVDVLGVAR